jgi:hypothetical protein
VSALFGSGTLGPATAGGSSSATFRVHAERGAVDLALIVDEGGHILTATWTPRPVRPPISDVH